MSPFQAGSAIRPREARRRRSRRCSHQGRTRPCLRHRYHPIHGSPVYHGGCVWSLLSFRFPEWVSLGEGSNTRSTCRFNALMTPIRTFPSATSAFAPATIRAALPVFRLQNWGRKPHGPGALQARGSVSDVHRQLPRTPLALGQDQSDRFHIQFGRKPLWQARKHVAVRETADAISLAQWAATPHASRCGS